MKHPILLMQRSDINRVAEIHCQAFPASRSTHLGMRYVRKMFLWFVEKQASLCFVSSEENGEINGYVVGALGGYGRKIFKFALAEIAFGLLTHPTLWLKRDTFALWYSYLQVFNPIFISAKKENYDGYTPGINLPIRGALAGIGVISLARGKGIGGLLVKAFEQAAKARGAKLIGLSVEIDNYVARQLYEKNGWQIDSLQPDLHSVHYSKVIL